MNGMGFGYMIMSDIKYVHTLHPTNDLKTHRDS